MTEQQHDHKLDEEKKPPLKRPAKFPAPGGLPFDQTRKLIKAIEKQGQSRHSFDLLLFCINNPTDWGFEGSLKQRQVQLRWGKCKSRSIQAYVNYLHRLGIDPNEKTLKELDNKESGTMVKSNKISDNDTYTTDVADDVSPEEEQMYKDAYGRLYGEQDYAAGMAEQDDDRKPAPRNLNRTPVKGGESPAVFLGNDAHDAHDQQMGQVNASNFFASPSPARHNVAAAYAVPGVDLNGGDPPQHVFGRVSPLLSRIPPRPPQLPNDVLHPFVPTSWLVNQNGTVKHPWIIAVNHLSAERNRDFDIQYVEGIDQDELFTRNGFHLRRSVPCQDHHLWDASIPDDVFGESWRGRLISMRGPAQDFWIRDPERYHKDEKLSKINCAATKKAHSATMVAIEDSDDGSYWAHYRFAFHPSIKLDNQIFSKDETVIPTEYNPIKMKSNDSENDFGRDLLGMTIFWRIACKGGTKIATKGKKNAEAARNMFGDL